jgi:type I restriction enzyme S subunit
MSSADIQFPNLFTASVSRGGTGWPQTALGDMGEIFCGQSPPTSTVNGDGRGVPYVSGPEQWNGQSVHLHKWTTAPKRVVPSGCVFITVKGAGVGTVFPGVAAAIGRDIYAVKPKDHVSPKYLEHALRFTTSEIIRSARGDIPDLSKHHLSSHLIALPPLAVQLEIVSEIEKQFTRLDAGIASLNRVQTALKRYRATVLKVACEGRLVPTEAELARREGRAYEPATGLLGRILQERRTQWESVQLAKFEAPSRAPKHPGWKNKYEGPQPLDEGSMPKLPAGWVWTNLDTVIIDGPQNGLYLPKTRYGRGHPILRIDDFQNGWVRTAAELNTVEADPETILTYRLELMDLVINRVNSLTHLGKCLVVRENVIPCLFESNMMRAKLACALIPRYVELYLHSAHGRIRLTKRAKWAVNQASINQQDVRRTLLPLPPAAEQERIVAAVEQRFSIIDELETAVMTNIKRAERLRQSILQRAFGGRL